MADVIDIMTPDGVQSVPIIKFTNQEVDFFTQDMGGDGATSFMAEESVKEIGQQFPNLFNYKSLKDGTAPIFDLDPENKNLLPKERALTDKDILTQFTNLEDLGYFSGLGRELFKAAPSAVGFYGGVKAGSTLTASIPPINPLFVGIKFGVPIVTGTLGAFGLYEMGDDAAEFVLGEEKPVIPSHKAAYESGKTTAGALSFLPLPFLISKNVSFGASTFLTNLNNLLSKGPVPKEQLTGAVQKAITKGKPPISTRLISGAETLLNKTGKEFRDKPKRMGFLEGLSVTGMTSGAYIAEETAPGSIGARISFELVGGLGPQLAFGSVIKNAEEIGNALKMPFSKEGRERLFSGLGKNKRQLDAVQKIRRLLDENEDNVEQLIKDLSDDQLTNSLFDEQGQLIKLTAGQKTGNPTLMAIEANLARSSQGLGKTRKENHVQANKALRNLIGALITSGTATGDKVALQKAAQLQKLRFDGYLSEKLALKSDRVLNAFKKIAGDQPVNNQRLSQMLFDVTGESLNQARIQEKLLYRDIGNFEITSFINTKGNQTDTPNFITYFLNEMPRTKEAKEEVLKNLGPLGKFVERKGKELGLPQFTDDIGRTTDFTKVDAKIDELLAFGAPKSQLQKSNSVLRQINIALKANNFNEIGLDDIKDGTKFTQEQISVINNYFKRGVGKPKSYKLPKGTPKERSADITRMTKNQLLEYNSAKNYFKEIAKKVGVEPSPAVAGVGDEVQPLTVVEIRDMRHLALDLGRTLVSQGKNNDARIAYGFAESLLRDLDSAPAGVNVAFDTARAYSKSLHDVYSRAFAGNILAKQKTGAQRRAPELLHKDLFIGGADPTFLRIQQIQEIGTFAKNQGLAGADDTIATVNGTLDQIIRNARAAAFDETTGRIDPKKLQAWNRQNKDLLQAFPALKVDLEDAEKANTLLNQFIKKDSNVQKSIKNQITYRDISGVENPTIAVLRAINSKFPTKALNSLVKAAKGDEQALAGLKTSMLETAMQRAGGSSETFSPRALYEALFTKLPNALDNRTTLMSYMQKNGVIKESEVNNFKRLIQEMVKLEAAEGIGQIDDVIEKTGAIVDFYLRITGSAIGTRLQSIAFGGQGPGSLVAAGAGSKALRSLFNSIPESMKTDVMTEVMQNPSLLASLLRKTTNEQQKLNIANKIKNTLNKAGFITVTKPVKESFRVTPSLIREAEEEEIDYTDPSFEGIEKQSSVQPNVTGFPTTQITARPDSGVNNRIAANVGSPPPAAPNINQRTQFASLFPGDITSGLIKANQPTQFMQEGGEVYDLREAPGVDDLRALTLEEFKNFTFQQLLNLKLEKDKELDKFNNPIKYLTQDFALGMNTPAAVAKLKQESFEKANQLEKQIQQYGMNREIAIQNYPQALAQGAPVSMRRKQDIESGNVQITGFPDYLVKPMQDGGAAYDMGLETDVAAQESIMSGLQGGDEDRSSALETKIPSTITQYNYGVDRPSRGIMNINNPLTQSLINSYIGYRVPGTNVTVSPFFDQEKQSITPGFQIQGSFADGGIVGLQLGGGVGDEFGGGGFYSEPDRSMDEFGAGGFYSEPRPMDLTQQDYDDFVTDRAAQIAAPQVGVRRSNIIQSRDYDPQYAQALNITRGRNIFGGIAPGNTAESVRSILGPSRFQERFPQGITSLSVPTDLIPQYGPAPGGGTYYSYGEKILQEPEGLLSFLMPGGFIKPFLETDIGKSIMGSDFVQGVKNFFQPSELKPDVTSNLSTVPTDTGDYSRYNLPENITYQNRQITNPVQALAIGIALNENRGVLDFETYKDAQDEYFRRRGRVNQIDVTGLNESI